MSDQPIVSADLLLTFRAPRMAVLIRDDAPLCWVSTELLPAISKCWSGIFTCIVPFDKETATLTDAAFFDLLRLFDPDVILCAYRPPAALREQLERSCLLGRDTDFFEYGIGAPEPTIPPFSSYAVELSDIGLEAIEPVISSSSDALLNLWWAAMCGESDGGAVSNRFGETSLDTVTAVVHALPFTLPKTPFGVTSSHVGGRDFPVRPDYNAQRFRVVFGDKLSDWALFQALRALGCEVVWIPSVVIHDKRMSYGCCRAILTRMNRMASETRALATSVSLRSDEMQHDLERLIESSATQDERLRDFDVVHPTAVIPDTRIVWSEANNFREEAHLFLSDTSVSKLGFLRPKNFQIRNGAEWKFLLEGEPLGFSYLSNPLASAPVQFDRSGQDWNSRRNRMGGVTVKAFSAGSFPGQDLDAKRLSPRLRRPQFIDELREIAGAAGFEIRETAKGRATKLVAALWEDDFDRLLKEFFSPDAQRLFRVLSLLTPETRRVAGLKEQLDGLGRILGSRLYLSSKLQNAFEPPLTLPTTRLLMKWLDASILVRGTILLCRSCAIRRFYRIEDATTLFKCQNCSEVQPVTTLAMGGRADPEYLYSCNGVIEALFRENGHYALRALVDLQNEARRGLGWVSELEFVDLTNNGKVKEVDMVINLDGELLIAEAKKNGVVTKGHLINYVQLANRFCADKIILVSGSAWSDKRKENFSQVMERERHVKLRLMHCDLSTKA